MKILVRQFLTNMRKFLNQLGFDPKKILNFKYYFKFRKQKQEWIKKGGKISYNHMILSDYEKEAGEFEYQYFHQDLTVAKQIYEDQPNRHVDIGSRLDGFVAHVASFREIELIDIRPLTKIKCHNIKFLKIDITKPTNLNQTDSLSCLHVAEHFGLGRYGDEIDINGFTKGIEQMVNLVKENGRLYISLPIGQNDEIHFNAHRILKPDTILKNSKISNEMKLIRFDLIDDTGEFYENILLKNLPTNIKNGCGIYTFKKKKIYKT